MTTAQVTALSTGLLAFIAIWATVLIPQLIVHQIRFGRILVRRLAATGAVILYGCLTVAVVMLPLPGPNTRSLAQTVQLVPFQWVTDVRTELREQGLSLVHAFTTTAFEQVTFNVLLFVPLGIFARVLWTRGLVGTTLLGFAASLLIEVTQLTANWGTAPFQYRIFDVDDLMTNTGGAALGWIAAALFLALRTSTVRTQPTANGALRRESARR